MTQGDDALIDGVSDLSRLSTHQLLERLVRGQQRMEITMSASVNYLEAALDSLDVQMTDLQTRLTADAENLRTALEGAHLASEDEAALVAAADRVQATAVLVSGLDMPSTVVPAPTDPAPTETPESADPEPAPSDPAPAPAPVADNPSTNI